MTLWRRGTCDCCYGARELDRVALGRTLVTVQLNFITGHNGNQGLGQVKGRAEVIHPVDTKTELELRSMKIKDTSQAPIFT